MDQAERLLQRCDELARVSGLESGILRAYMTPEHLRANRIVSGWMQAAGMHSWFDQAGNIWGRYPSADAKAKTLIIGSHLDTVPNAGKYDGILGVLAGIELVDDLNKNQVQLPFHLDVVGFADEEGYRFGAALLGSHAIAGNWKPDWNQLTDRNGITLSAAFAESGFDIEAVADAALDSSNLLGYWELHIEQGPVLEDLNLPVGVVTGIAGARRFELIVTGQAGHAGTVPMDLRQDALVAAAEVIQAIETLAVENKIVATVGRISAKPGGVNVIPGEVRFSLDVRSENDQLRDRVIVMIEDQMKAVCERRGLRYQIEETHAAAAVRCDEGFMNIFSTAIKACGYDVHRLVSGAGHDAMALASVCKVAMLFMRCKKGISHHPDESVTVADTAVSLTVLKQALFALVESLSIEARS